MIINNKIVYTKLAEGEGKNKVNVKIPSFKDDFYRYYFYIVVNFCSYMFMLYFLGLWDEYLYLAKQAVDFAYCIEIRDFTETQEEAYEYIYMLLKIKKEIRIYIRNV